MPDAIYEIIRDHGGSTLHIAEKNDILIPVTLALGKDIYQRNDAIIDAVGKESVLAGLAQAIIAKLPPVPERTSGQSPEGPAQNPDTATPHEPDSAAAPSPGETFSASSIETALKNKDFAKAIELLKDTEKAKKFRLEDKNWWLVLSIKDGQKNLVDTLLGAGAEINADIPYVTSIFSKISPLALATRLGNADLVKHLLSKGADINTKDQYGNTSLGVSISTSKFDVAKILLNAGADVNGALSKGSGYHILLKFAENSALTDNDSKDMFQTILNGSDLAVVGTKGSILFQALEYQDSKRNFILEKVLEKMKKDSNNVDNILNTKHANKEFLCELKKVPANPTLVKGFEALNALCSSDPKKPVDRTALAPLTIPANCEELAAAYLTQHGATLNANINDLNLGRSEEIARQVKVKIQQASNEAIKRLPIYRQGPA